jgi:hypothetical protein
MLEHICRRELNTAPVGRGIGFVATTHDEQERWRESGWLRETARMATRLRIEE